MSTNHSLRDPIGIESAARRTRSHRRVLAAFCFASVAALVLSGCATETSASRDSATYTPVAPPVSRTITPSGGAGPSEAAQMTCGVQTQASVAAALSLRDLPVPTSEWANSMFVCTYELEDGPLVLTVKELADSLSAQRYYDGLRQHSGQSVPIDGLGSLGLPGYQTESGVVVFVKDNMTLQVDASAMETQIGPNLVSRTEFAYQIATNVLACWKAHH